MPLAIALHGDPAGRVLVERGADPHVTNAVGRLPTAVMALSADLAGEVAPLVGRGGHWKILLPTAESLARDPPAAPPRSRGVLYSSRER